VTRKTQHNETGCCKNGPKVEKVKLKSAVDYK